MSDFPDFSSHGYQVKSQLGHNSMGGRVTYLAKNLKTRQPVVIKQFQFAQLGATWAEYEAYEQEIKVLQSLDRPGIPLYLDSFQTSDGFCMVQEYIDAPDATRDRTWTPQKIKQVAISALEILVDLQSQNPPVIHRDIKPENILIDDQLNVYLVDFGFARMGGGEVAASSVVKGTLGFMPPEQLFNRQLTEASDLYGLGATLICLLTGTKSVDIGNLVDDNYCIHFRHLVPPLQRGWINWLEKMVEPKPQDRYPSAVLALAALKTLDVSRLPKVRISRDNLNFTCSQFGEKLTQTISVSNPIPDTLLSGKWEVEAHPSDPPHTPYDHAWISFDLQKFESNDAECKITVDTSKLLAGETYTRQILLQSNSSPDTLAIAIQVQTAALPVPKKTPYISFDRLGFMFLFFCLIFCLIILLFWSDDVVWYWGLMLLTTILVAGFATVEKTMMAKVDGIEIKPFQVLAKAGMGAILGAAIAAGIEKIFLSAAQSFLIISFGSAIGALMGSKFEGIRTKSITVLIITIECLFLGFVILEVALKNVGLLYGMVAMVVVGHAIALLCWRAVKSLVQSRMPDQFQRGFYAKDSIAIALLTAGLCISLGGAFQLSINVARQLDWVQPLELVLVTGGAIASLAATSLPLLNLIIFKRARIVAQYRKSEPHLIKP